METALLIFFIFILLLFSGFCSGSESALFSLSAVKLKSYQSSSDPKKQLIAKLLARPQDLLVTIFMLNTLVNILLQNSAAHFFGEYASWGLKVGVPLVLTLIFGELLPKYVGLQTNESFAYLVAPSVNILQNIFKPIRKATIAITSPISRLLFFFLKKEPEISREELKHILDTSEQYGVFSTEEGELIEGYLELQDSDVKELMNPRDDIAYYCMKEPISKLTYLFIDSKHSRIPVCANNLDEILGVINAQDFFVYRDELTSPPQLLPLLIKPMYVPELLPARQLLRRFLEQKQHLALVVDEHRSVSGLITYADLLQLVLGESADERDKERLFTQAGSNEIIASGKLELEEFNEIFGSQLVSPNNMVTIGGWLIERLGEIPKGGTKYEFEGYLFHVLAATPSRVKRLYIRKLRKEAKK